MNRILTNIVGCLKQDRLLLILIAAAIFGFGLFWLVAFLKVQAETLPLILIAILLVINIFLAFTVWTRETLASYFLVGTCIFIEIIFFLYLLQPNSLAR